MHLHSSFKAEFSNSREARYSPAVVTLDDLITGPIACHVGRLQTDGFWMGKMAHGKWIDTCIYSTSSDSPLLKKARCNMNSARMILTKAFKVNESAILGIPKVND